MINQKDKFDQLTTFYQTQDWINKPNIFAQEVLEYLPSKGRVLCLGDGQGQDSRFFASKGYNVIATDLSDKALEINKNKSSEAGLTNISIEKLDLLNPFPYEDNSFNIVYAHLSLHYFDLESTKKIIAEIYRVLKKDGYFCTFNNSTSDPEYTKGKTIEQDYIETEGVRKRFFSVDSIRELVDCFQTILLDNKGETYKDSAKGVHNLIRYIGKKL